MVDTPPLCPTCHSKISASGKRTKDADSTGVPTWSNDPMITPSGVNGDFYKGQQLFFASDIIEIQNARKQQEMDLGISPLTEFSQITSKTVGHLACHIIELRISTERLLDSTGTSLQDYFRLDDDGNTQPPGPQDILDKTEWTDVVRGSSFNNNGKNISILLNSNQQFKLNDTDTKDSPTIPRGTQVLKGIHIEDLRHPVPNALTEFFIPAVDFDDTLDGSMASDFFTGAGVYDITDVSDALIGTIFDDYPFSYFAGFVNSSTHSNSTGVHALHGATSVATVKIDENTPVDGTSHKITMTGMVQGSYQKYTNVNMILGDSHFVWQSWAGNTFNIKSDISTYLKGLRTVKDTTKCRVYFDYSLNDLGRVNDGNPSVPPFFSNPTVHIEIFINFVRPENLSIPGTFFDWESRATIDILPDSSFSDTYLQKVFIIGTGTVLNAFQLDPVLNLYYIDIPVAHVIGTPTPGKIYTPYFTLLINVGNFPNPADAFGVSNSGNEFPDIDLTKQMKLQSIFSGYKIIG